MVCWSRATTSDPAAWATLGYAERRFAVLPVDARVAELVREGRVPFSALVQPDARGHISEKPLNALELLASKGGRRRRPGRGGETGNPRQGGQGSSADGGRLRPLRRPPPLGGGPPSWSDADLDADGVFARGADKYGTGLSVTRRTRRHLLTAGHSQEMELVSPQDTLVILADAATLDEPDPKYENRRRFYGPPVGEYHTLVLIVDYDVED